MRQGLVNLTKHVENITEKFGLPVVVAVNCFPSDTKAELQLVFDTCNNAKIPVAISEVFSKGSDGGMNLAEKVIEIIEKGENSFRYIYPLESGIKQKIDIIARKYMELMVLTLQKKLKRNRKP